MHAATAFIDFIDIKMFPPTFSEKLPRLERGAQVPPDAHWLHAPPGPDQVQGPVAQIQAPQGTRGGPSGEGKK